MTGSVEYYAGFCLDWLGQPMVEAREEWLLDEDSRVVYPQGIGGGAGLASGYWGGAGKVCMLP